MSKLAKFITPFPISKFLYCCFQELQRELKENKVGVSADFSQFLSKLRALYAILL